MKANEEVREATLRSLTLTSAFRISSEIPSLKYSFSGSELRFRKGRTAIDRSTVDRDSGAAFFDGSARATVLESFGASRTR